MLDFRTETFLTVCEYMNFTKAAEKLSLTQPAISGHIRYLENYYRVKLFSYENKKLQLTKQGELLKRALQTMVHDDVRLKKELSAIKPQKHYRIGATLSIGEAYLPKFLTDYLDNNSDTELEVTVANTATLLGKMDQGLLDIILTEGYFPKDEYESTPIREESFAILCGSKYKLGKTDSLDKIFSCRLISREKGSGTRAVFEHYLNDNGYSINAFSNICEFSSLNLIKEMLKSNQGISVLYRCVVEDLINEGLIREVKIPGFRLTHDFNAVWQKNSMYGKENEEFIKTLREWQAR